MVEEAVEEESEEEVVVVVISRGALVEVVEVVVLPEHILAPELATRRGRELLNRILKIKPN